MAFRRIPRETRINAIKECIKIENTKETAKKYGISEATLKSDCNDLLKETEEMLKKNSLAGKLKRLLKRMYQKLSQR
jgi:DNA invertase Pin-like site-specific DNA recombinase